MYGSGKYEYLFDQKYLYNEEGQKVEIIRKSNIVEEEFYRVYMKIPKKESYDYGKTISGYKLYTGNIYRDALVVSKECVYKGEDDAYHVRIVDAEGNFLDERTVEVGYTCEELICVTGVEEGELCDSGYKSLYSEEQADEKE